MPINSTLKRSYPVATKKAPLINGESRSSKLEQTPSPGASKAIYTTLPAAQKAQYARELKDYYSSSQQNNSDLSKKLDREKSKQNPNTTTRYADGHEFGGSSGSFDDLSLYDQRQQQKDEAKKELFSRWVDLLGTAAVQSQNAAAGIYISPEEQLSLFRRQAENVQAIRESKASFEEANAVIDWDGRDDLIAALEELDRQAGWEINEEQANENERLRQELLAQLRAGDLTAGNGMRSGTDADTGRDVVASTAKGIAGATVKPVTAPGYMN